MIDNILAGNLRAANHGADGAREVGAYRSDARTAARNELLVLGQVDLVFRIARQLLRRMPGNVELDDLVQAGMVGLLEAGQRYAVRETSSFTTFARHRIRGAMLDSLRKGDWSPRSLRRRARDIARTRQCIERDTCKAATPAAIAAGAGLPLDTYHQTIRDCNLSMLLNLDEFGSSLSGQARAEAVDAKPRPDEELEQEQARHAMQAEIEALPESERAILLLYYDEELLMREIGVMLELTESRVCQVLKQIVGKLRAAAQRTLDRVSDPRDSFPRGVFDSCRGQPPYAAMRRSRRMRIKNSGTPITAVSAPTGSCRGDAATRARVSARVSSVPPSRIDAGTTTR